MLGDVTSAGTLIAAVLETAGQVTQAHILADFNDFFHHAGAMLYIMAGIGGIVSFVLFNSFRMARYMLIGPTLFWFLLGPGHESEGVVWELADGTQKSVNGVFEGSTPLADDNFKPAGDIKISYVFAFFTGIINEVVTNMTSVILDQKNDSQLLFIARTRAFENLMNSTGEDAQLLSMLESNLFSAECSRMMNISLALANPLINPSKIGTDYDVDNTPSGSSAGLWSPGICQVVSGGMYEVVGELELMWQATPAGAQKDKLEEDLQGFFTQKQALCDEYVKLRDKARNIQANPATLQFLRETQEESGAAQSFLDRATSATPSPGYGGKRVCADSDNPAAQTDCITDVRMSCGDLWEITQQALVKHASWISDKLLDEYKSPDEPNGMNDAQRICRAIHRKLHPNQNPPPVGSCDFVQAASIFIMQNAINKRSGNRIGEEMQNRAANMGMLRTIAAGTISLADENGDHTESEQYRLDPSKDFRFRHDEEKGLLIQAYRVNEDGSRGEETWLPYARIGQIYGHMDSAFDEHQAYQTRGLRQQIFTYALNLPYYQGVILYLISVAYPFICLVVLMPGRATAILAIPMAWLWVKSWDIGFAMCMVLDDILWAMFPQRDIGVNLDSQTVAVPDVLKEAFEVDPSYNVHGYYMFMSMCIMAVPGITGYMTLKARSSVLSSFTAGPRDAAKDANERAEGAYGVMRMNQRVRQMNEMRGMAGMSKTASWGAMTGQGRGKRAAGYAALQGAARAFNNIAGGGEAGDWDQATKRKHAAINQRRRRQGLSPIPIDKIGGARRVRSGAQRMGNAQNIVNGVAGGAAHGLRQFGGMLGTEVNHAVAMSQAYDEKFGRWGAYQMMADSSAAAMDAAGGFEMNNTGGADGVGATIALHTARFNAVMNAGGDALAGVAGMFGGGLKENKGEFSTGELLVMSAPGLYALIKEVAPETTAELEEGVSSVFGEVANMFLPTDFELKTQNMSAMTPTAGMRGGAFNVYTDI